MNKRGKSAFPWTTFMSTRTASEPSWDTMTRRQPSKHIHSQLTAEHHGRNLAATSTVTIYTDGSCLTNPGPGGWGAIVFRDGDEPTRLSGGERATTNNRMEMTAAIKGLEATPAGTSLDLHSDSQYLVNTMTRHWKRRKNQDLWELLDLLAADRQVTWHWVRGHDGNHWNEEADRLALSAAKASSGQRQRK